MNPDASPTARALLALELIQGSPGITADRLADRLGVSGRAARRYVGILREAEIPIDSVRGPHGGYRVGRSLRLPPLMFTAAEALGLVMAVLDGHHDASDPGEPVGSALGKIVRALPEPVAAQAEALRQTTAPAPDRAAARPDPATTTALVRACSDRRRVRLGYRTEAGSQWVIEVDPWAVVVRHGRWYLLCWSRAAQARRAYRVDRVRDVELLEGSFSLPADLDPVAMLEDHLAVGWEYDVEVVIDAPLDAVTRHVPRALGRLEPLEAEGTRLTGSTSSPAWYAEQLAAIPVSYRIVRCPELQEAARVLGQRLLTAGSPAGTDQGATPRHDRAARPRTWAAPGPRLPRRSSRPRSLPSTAAVTRWCGMGGSGYRRVMDELADDLLLLSAGSDGRLTFPVNIRFGLAGSELVRLAAAGRVDIVRGRIVIRDTVPTGDPLLDAALASMDGSNGPTARAWVARLRPDLVQQYLSRAEAAGIIRADRRKALGFIPVTRWTVVDATRAARVRARLAEVAADTGPVDPALAALAGLASAIGLTRVLFPGRDGAPARQRLREARSDVYDAQQATGAAAQAATRAAAEAATGAATEAAVSAAVAAATQAAISAATDTAHHCGGHAGGHGAHH